MERVVVQRIQNRLLTNRRGDRNHWNSERRRHGRIDGPVPIGETKSGGRLNVSASRRGWIRLCNSLRMGPEDLLEEEGTMVRCF